jgi:hypothetical protein
MRGCANRCARRVRPLRLEWLTSSWTEQQEARTKNGEESKALMKRVRLRWRLVVSQWAAATTATSPGRPTCAW